VLSIHRPLPRQPIGEPEVGVPEQGSFSQPEGGIGPQPELRARLLIVVLVLGAAVAVAGLAGGFGVAALLCGVIRLLHWLSGDDSVPPPADRRGGTAAGPDEDAS
jgi:hypothetical protein